MHNIFRVIHHINDTRVTYIFTGKVPASIKKILLSLQTLTDSELTKISKRNGKDAKALTEHFGSDWLANFIAKPRTKGGDIDAYDDIHEYADTYDMHAMDDIDDIDNLISGVNVNEIIYNDSGSKLKKNILPTYDFDEQVYRIFIMQYSIMPDDTILRIKEKITLSIPTRFNNNQVYMMPKYQYLWDPVNNKSIGHTIYSKYNDFKLPATMESSLYSYEIDTIDTVKYIKEALHYNIVNNVSFAVDNYNYHILNDVTQSNELHLIDLLSYIDNKTINDQDNLYSVFVSLYFNLVTRQDFKLLVDMKAPHVNEEYINMIAADIPLENAVMMKLHSSKDKINDNMLSLRITQCQVNLNLPILAKPMTLTDLFNQLKVDDVLVGLTIKSNELFVSRYYTNDADIYNKLASMYMKENGLVIHLKILNKIIAVRFKDMVSSIEVSMALSYSDMSDDMVKNIQKQVCDIINKRNSMVSLDKSAFYYLYINLNMKLKVNKPDAHLISERLKIYYPYINVTKKGDTCVKFQYIRVNNFTNEHMILAHIISLLQYYDIDKTKLLNYISQQYSLSMTYTEMLYKQAAKRALYTKGMVKKVFDPRVSKRTDAIKCLLTIQDTAVSVNILGIHTLKQMHDIPKNILTMIVIEPTKTLTNIYDIVYDQGKIMDIIDENDTTLNTIDHKSIDRLNIKTHGKHTYYTRICQNIGKVKRRPIMYDSTILNKMMKKKYVEIEKGIFERNTKYGKTHAIKINDIYYECSPEHHGDNMHIGLLSKTAAIKSHCIPCCFKKPSIGKAYGDKFTNVRHCINDNLKSSTTRSTDNSLETNIVNYYVLNDAVKININKLSTLPFELDSILNKDRSFTRKNNILKLTTGYFFKLGYDDPTFVGALNRIFKVNVLDEVIHALESNIGEHLFMYINNGHIFNKFKGRDKFIDYIKEAGTNISIDYLFNLICMPDVLLNTGMLCHVLMQDNNEWKLYCGVDESYGRDGRELPGIIILYQYNIYIPVCYVTKPNNKIDLQTIYPYDLYSPILSIGRICDVVTYINSELSAKYIDTYAHAVKQLVNMQLGFVTHIVDKHNNYIPVSNSGILYNVPVITARGKLNDVKSAWAFFEKFAKDNNQPPYVPIGYYYTENNVHSIMLTNGLAAYIEPFDIKKLPKKAIMEELLIDNVIIDKSTNAIVEYHKRESYNRDVLMLFKYRLYTQTMLSSELLDILNNYIESTAINDIKNVLYYICDSKLYKLYSKEYGKTVTLENKINIGVRLIDTKVDLSNYKSYAVKYNCNPLLCTDDMLLINRHDFVNMVNYITEEMINIGFASLIYTIDMYTFTSITDQSDQHVINWNDKYNIHTSLVLHKSTKLTKAIRSNINTYDKVSLYKLSEPDQLYKCIVNALFWSTRKTLLGDDSDEYIKYIPIIKTRVANLMSNNSKLSLLEAVWQIIRKRILVYNDSFDKVIDGIDLNGKPAKTNTYYTDPNAVAWLINKKDWYMLFINE